MSTQDSEAQALAEACVMQTDYNAAANARERGWRNVGGELWLQVETVRAHRKTIKEALSWAKTTLSNIVTGGEPPHSNWLDWVDLWSRFSDEQRAALNPIERIAYEIIMGECRFLHQAANKTAESTRLVQIPQPGDEERRAAAEAAAARRQRLLSSTVTVHHQDGTSEEVSLQELHGLILADAPRLSPDQLALIDRNRVYGG